MKAVLVDTSGKEVFATDASNVVEATGVIRYQTRYFYLTKKSSKLMTFSESTVVDLPLMR